MKTLVIVAAFIVMLSVSCNQSPAQQSVKTETPVAAKTDVADMSLTNTRSSNIVDGIYSQLVDKNPALKQLELQIEQLSPMKSDSAKMFDDFNNSNKAYYASAAAYAADIKDSVLRVKIKDMLAQSQTAYTSKTAQFNNLETAVSDKTETLSNLHILLKLVKTMAAIEQYQNTAMPSFKPLQNVLAGYNSTIAKTQQLAKK